MQELLAEISLLFLFAAGIGIISSMVGMSGGAFKTPLLIIVFGLGAEMAAASSLFSALFVAIVSAVAYWRHEVKPIFFRIGMVLALLTIPGSWLGIVFRTYIGNDFFLRIIFGILLFPVAFKMLFSSRKEFEDHASEIAAYDMSTLSKKMSFFAGLGIFLGGISAGLLGIGGGIIIVPVLCLMLGMPMLAATATSMFTMIFTTSAGTVLNYLILPQYGDLPTFLFYSLALGAGMVIGGLIGPRYASKIHAEQLMRFFGVILVFPLVKMMKLGQLWLDPLDQSFLMATIGDVIIWLVIVLPIGLLRYYQIRKNQSSA
ncbi:MAG: sulfite exporter TauE/SafE family protein [Candidatus Hodarchaeota archaeon]